MSKSNQWFRALQVARSLAQSEGGPVASRTCPGSDTVGCGGHYMVRALRDIGAITLDDLTRVVPDLRAFPSRRVLISLIMPCLPDVEEREVVRLVCSVVGANDDGRFHRMWKLLEQLGRAQREAEQQFEAELDEMLREAAASVTVRQERQRTRAFALPTASVA